MSQNNVLQYPLDDVKRVVNKWLFLEDSRVIDIIMATYIANKLRGEPNWLIIIGPPSHTKTELLLRSLNDLPDAFFLSNLTPSTLVSGISPKKGQQDPSLLLKLNGKTLILKDFTTILSLRSEAQAEILSQLREIYDGRYVKAFGTGKTIDWKGHVGLLAACTPVYDKHYAVIGTLGDRFLLYRVNNDNQTEMGLQAQRIVGQEEEMRDEIQQAVHTFAQQFNNLATIRFDKDAIVNNQIVSLACFCAYGRCPVERDRMRQYVEYIPMPEGPARLVKQFMQLGMGLALARRTHR